VAKPELTNVKSMMELVPALENIGFVPEISNTKSNAAMLSTNSCPRAFVRGEPQPVAQAFTQFVLLQISLSEG